MAEIYAQSPMTGNSFPEFLVARLILGMPKGHVPADSCQRARQLPGQFSWVTTSFPVSELRGGSSSHPGYVFRSPEAHRAKEAIISFCSDCHSCKQPAAHPRNLSSSIHWIFCLSRGGELSDLEMWRLNPCMEIQPSGSLLQLASPAAFGLPAALSNSTCHLEPLCTSPRLAVSAAFFQSISEMSFFRSSLLWARLNFIHLLTPSLERFLPSERSRMSNVKKYDTWLRSSEFSFSEGIPVKKS